MPTLVEFRGLFPVTSDADFKEALYSECESAGIRVPWKLIRTYCYRIADDQGIPKSEFDMLVGIEKNFRQKKGAVKHWNTILYFFSLEVAGPRLNQIADKMISSFYPYSGLLAFDARIQNYHAPEDSHAPVVQADDNAPKGSSGAWTLIVSIDGNDVVRYVNSYFAKSLNIEMNKIIDTVITVSDDYTGITDYGKEWCSINIDGYGHILIVEDKIYELILDNIPAARARFEIAGLGFEEKPAYRRTNVENNNLLIQNLDVSVVLVKSLNFIESSDFPNMVQEIFRIQACHNDLFWGPGRICSRIFDRLIEEKRPDLISDIILHIDAKEPNTKWSQLIKLGWYLLHHQKQWISSYGMDNVYDLLSKSDELSEPLVNSLKDTLDGSQNARLR